MTQTLDTNSIMQMSLFEKITRSKVKDCFDNKKLLTFVVQNGEMSKAIGKKGANVKKLESLFKKKLRIIEYNPDITKFIQNLCYPNEVTKVEYSEQMLWDKEKRAAIITPASLKSRGFIIGKEAANLRTMEEVVRRYFKIDEIRVESAEKTENEEKSGEIGEKIDEELNELLD